MKRRLILHIGLQKTGTSSIQVMLAGSGEYLSGQGFFFPQLPRTEQRPSQVWLSPFRHNIIAGTYADYKSAFENLTPEEAVTFWDSLYSDGRTPILSAEDVSRQQNFRLFADVLPNFNLEVVMYLRRQDLFIESLYNQRNKILISRGDPKFLSSDFLTEQDAFTFIKQEKYIPVLNFSKTLERIKTQLSPQKIHVRVFDRTLLKGGDVCADFASIFDWDVNALFHPGREANGSISTAVLDKLKSVFLEQGQEAARAEIAAVNKAREQGKDLAGSYRVFCDQTRRNILRQYSEINKELYEVYGVQFAAN